MKGTALKKKKRSNKEKPRGVKEYRILPSILLKRKKTVSERK